MSGLQVSLITYLFLFIIGMGIACLIWAVPKLMAFLPGDHKSK